MNAQQTNLVVPTMRPRLPAAVRILAGAANLVVVTLLIAIRAHDFVSGEDRSSFLETTLVCGEATGCSYLTVERISDDWRLTRAGIANARLVLHVQDGETVPVRFNTERADGFRLYRHDGAQWMRTDVAKHAPLLWRASPAPTLIPIGWQLDLVALFLATTGLLIARADPSRLVRALWYASAAGAAALVGWTISEYAEIVMMVIS